VQRAYAVLATLSGSYSPQIGTSPTRYSAVCHSQSEDCAFDLHVLGTPPAFTLSQDQTLHHELPDVAFAPFSKPSPSHTMRGSTSQKEIKCFTEYRAPFRRTRFANNTHGGCSSHLALLPSFLWHVMFHRSHLSFFHKEKMKLCSTLLLFRCTHPPTVVRNRSSRHKKTEKPQKWQSRDPSTNLRPLAWVCCPLIGSSLRLDV
jgi:hypothetical protein